MSLKVEKTPQGWRADDPDDSAIDVIDADRKQALQRARDAIEYNAAWNEDESEPAGDADITRFKKLIAELREQAAGILRAAGFDPDELEQADKNDLTRQHERGHNELYTFRFFPFRTGKLDDAADPASAAYRMLRFTRLAEELIHTKDAYTVIYAFDLGRLFDRAAIGMQYPEVTAAIVKRQTKHAASFPRPDALQKLIITILKDDPSLTANDVLSELRKHERQGVIETITDEVIEWTGETGTAENTPISALNNRVSRAKKQTKKIPLAR